MKKEAALNVEGRESKGSSPDGLAREWHARTNLERSIAREASRGSVGLRRSRQMKDKDDVLFRRDSLAVQQRRFVAPLTQSFRGGVHQDRWSGNIHSLHGTLFIDQDMSVDDAFDCLGQSVRRVFGQDSRYQLPRLSVLCVRRSVGLRIRLGANRSKGRRANFD